MGRDHRGTGREPAPDRAGGARTARPDRRLQEPDADTAPSGRASLSHPLIGLGPGLEVGAGLVLADGVTGLAVDVRVRWRLVHQAAGFADSRVSVSVSYNPTPDTSLGLTARVSPAWGGPAGAGKRRQVSEDRAERLYHLYVKELQESPRPPIDPKVSVYQINALIRAAERLGPERRARPTPQRGSGRTSTSDTSPLGSRSGARSRRRQTPTTR